MTKPTKPKVSTGGSGKRRKTKGGLAAEEQPKYKPTAREREAIDAFFAARKSRKPSSRLTIKKNASGAFVIGIGHEDPSLGQILLMQGIGTTDFDFAGGILRQVSSAVAKGGEEDANFVLSVISGIEPKDQVEAMLAAQMATVHMATMTFARRLADVSNIQQQDSAQNAFNKLARTFTAQVEALKRYRSTGQQKVTVEHVTVNAGGQAIVGNVSHGTPANDPGQPPLAAITAQSETPLPLPSVEGVGDRKKARLIS